MPAKTAIARPTAQSIASYVTKNAEAVRKSQRPMHMSESVREADYEGHHIVIRTMYKITVDGVPVTGHLGVTDDGQVHYHPVPNASFASAVDMVKRIIDVFSDDFTGHPPGGGNGNGGHMGHMARRTPRKAAKARKTSKATTSRTSRGRGRRG
jgi:hypothetical protein